MRRAGRCGWVDAGDTVRGDGATWYCVPVGPELLGRVVDPLGRPLDGKGPIGPTRRRHRTAAPSIIDGDAVINRCRTGIIVVDTVFALVRSARV